MRAPEELTGAGGKILVRAGKAALLQMLLTLVPSKCITPPPPLFRAHARSRSHFAGISESPSQGSSASGRRPTAPAAFARSHEVRPALLPSATAARLTGRVVSASGRGTLSRRLLTAVSVCRSTCSPSLAKACCIMSSRSRLPCHPRVRSETVFPPPLIMEGEWRQRGNFFQFPCFALDLAVFFRSDFRFTAVPCGSVSSWECLRPACWLSTPTIGSAPAIGLMILMRAMSTHAFTPSFRPINTIWHPPQT